MTFEDILSIISILNLEGSLPKDVLPDFIAVGLSGRNTAWTNRIEPSETTSLLGRPCDGYVIASYCYHVVITTGEPEFRRSAKILY
jgi:hypothetical protein